LKQNIFLFSGEYFELLLGTTHPHKTGPCERAEILILGVANRVAYCDIIEKGDPGRERLRFASFLQVKA
jgi:hypothetical protein